MEKKNNIDIPAFARSYPDFTTSSLSTGETQDVFGFFFDDDGVRQFGKVGVRNVQDEINSCKDSCDYNLIKKYLLENGVSDNGIYGVRPDLISDVNELSDKLHQADSLYKSLPDVIKQKYKNMFEVVNGFSEEDLSLLKDSGSSVQPVTENSEVAKDE